MLTTVLPCSSCVTWLPSAASAGLSAAGGGGGSMVLKPPHPAANGRGNYQDQNNGSLHGFFSFVAVGLVSITPGVIISMGRWTASSRAARDCCLLTCASNCPSSATANSSWAFNKSSGAAAPALTCACDGVARLGLGAGQILEQGQAFFRGAKTFHGAVNVREHFGLKGVEARGGFDAPARRLRQSGLDSD